MDSRNFFSRAYSMGGHRSFQQCDAGSVVAVPRGLKPEEAVIARLMGVTMTTLKTTTARPGDMVIVSGAGPVGYLGAHLFNNAGFDVEPGKARSAAPGARRIYRRHRPSPPAPDR